MNLLIALFLIMFEALYEGFKLRKLHIVSEFIEMFFLGVIAFIVLAYSNGYLPQRPYNPDFWFVFLVMYY